MAKRAPLATALLIATGGLTGIGGCVYRLDIQQGNYLEESRLAQVETGMSRSQVRFLLGTPMVADTFHQDRWDYPYYYRRGRSRNIETGWCIVYFDEDAVVRIDREYTVDPKL